MRPTTRAVSFSAALRALKYANAGLDQNQSAVAAQLAILRNCQSAIMHLLKQDDSTYVAAKVVVLARLLHKTLSQQPDSPPLVEKLRNRLASLRTRLLASIERNFSNPDLESHQLVSNLSAYALATSSSPTGVLEHFLKVRRQAVGGCSVSTNQARENMIRALKLFKGALSSVHMVFPRRLSEALKRLKMHPLSQDKEIRSLADLNLDVLGRWIAEEVQNYTPWPRHDELTQSQAENITTSQIPDAMTLLQNVFENVLNDQDDFETVLKLREYVIGAHLSSLDRTPGYNASAILDMLRNAFNSRLSELAERKANSIADLSQHTNTVLDNWESTPDDPDASLWTLAEEPPTLERGASVFKEAVQARFHCNTPQLDSCVTLADAWADAVSRSRAALKSAMEKRWDDEILDAPTDADDGIDLDSIQSLLGEEDTRSVENAFDRALHDALATFHDDFGKAASKADTLAKNMFLLRLLRDLAQKVETLAKIDLKHGALSQPLHQRIAVAIANTALQNYKRALLGMAQAHHFSQNMLWEGHPALPSQPSPAVFKLLSQTSKDMTKAGQDAWSPGLIDAVKSHIANELAMTFNQVTEEVEKVVPVSTNGSLTNGTVNGVGDEAVKETSESISSPDEKKDDLNGDGDPHPAVNGEDTVSSTDNETADQESKDLGLDAATLRQDKFKQVLFDVSYLQRILTTRRTTATGTATIGGDLQDVVQTLKAKANVDTDAADKIKRGSTDYWRRTYLLFGLLA